MKKRVLFVDDEPQVLQGLRRMLHSQTREWELHFATGGKEALELMAATPMDVIVSDMRMPGMAGVQLLGEVKKLYPKMARVALSGHMGERMIIDSTKVAHQFLSKPCSADKLVGVVARILNLRKYLAEEALGCLAQGMDQIPSLPDLYAAIQVELNSPNMSLRKVGEIISKDLGMSAKVLQLVNSSFFGLFTEVTNPAQAVNLLGSETVKALVLHAQIFSQYNPKKCRHFSLPRLARHSLEMGTLAKNIALLEGAPQNFVENTFLAGIMHDVGQLMLAVNFPELYNELLELVQAKKMVLWRVEQEVFGAGHAQLGAYQLGLWGMPDPVVEAIAFHHHPRHVGVSSFIPLTALHAAEAFDDLLQPGMRTGRPMPLDAGYIESCGLTERIETWQAKAQELLAPDQS